MFPLIRRTILPLLFRLLLADSWRATDTTPHVVSDFASRLRSGQYMPLRDFFACKKLIAIHDRRGSARSGAATSLND